MAGRYVYQSEEVTRESLTRLRESWGQLLRDAARGQHVDHVLHELVVRVELALDAVEATLKVLQDSANGVSRLDQGSSDLAGSAAAADARLNVLDLRDQLSEALDHARSLIPPDD